MQGKLAVFVHNGVTGIVAALIAADDIIFLGDQIDHAAFSFVAPVDANDCTIAHRPDSLSRYNFIPCVIIARMWH